jgi:hypothetical protein
MALETGAFPYDKDNLLGGAARVLYAPDSEAIPTSIADVIDMETPYTSQSGWVDLGATRDAASYARGVSAEGYQIQQLSGDVLEEITEITRTMTVSIAEIKAEHLQIMEEANSIGAVAAGALTSAQESVKVGLFADVSNYRVCFIGQRLKESGLVTEDTTPITRGRFVMLCLYNTTISAEESGMEFDKGTLVAAPLTFKSFPESGEAEGEEYGIWLTEDAGTITP